MIHMSYGLLFCLFVCFFPFEKKRHQAQMHHAIKPLFNQYILIANLVQPSKRKHDKKHQIWPINGPPHFYLFWAIK